MAGTDIVIVAISLILALTYGTFLFMYSDENSLETNSFDYSSMNSTTPDTGVFSFMDSVSNVINLSTDNPEIFFVNTILFGTIGFLISMIGVRLIRGQG